MYLKWIEAIKKSGLFRDINNEELNVMLECLRPRICSYKRNELITVEGERFEGVGILLSGNASVTRENAAGNRIIITMLKPGSMFGEMAAFSGKGVWPATVFAQDACVVTFLPPEKILGSCERACASHRMLILNMLKIISNKALMLNTKVEYLTIKSMRGKISRFLMEQHKKTGSLIFMLPMKRNELADFLNVSRPSLSREMCRMKEEGIIDFHMASIRIKDIEALKRIIEYK